MSKLERLIEELCPDGVEYKELKNVCVGKYGKGNKIPIDGGLFPVYGCYGVVGSTSTYNNENSPIVGHIGSAGKVVWGEGKHFVTYNGTICKPIDTNILNSKYLFYFLKKSNLEKYVKGSQPFLSFSDYSKLEIPVPPLPIQEEIVRILDSFTELKAQLEEELEARKKQYEWYRDNLLDFGNNVEYKPLKLICDVRDGTHNSPKKSDNGKYLVTSKNIKNGKVDLNNCYKISEIDYCEINKRSKVNKYDILFTMIGTIGEVALIENEPDYAIKNVGLIKTNNILLSKYLKYFLTSHYIKKYIDNNKSKGSQSFLALGKLRDMMIPLPPLEEQQRIVDILDRFDKLCNDITEGLPAEIDARQKQYEYYRDKLLTFKRLGK